MATISVLSPFINGSVKNGRQKIDALLPNTFGIIKRTNVASNLIVTVPNCTILSTSAISYPLITQSLEIYFTKPIVRAYLAKSSSTGGESVETYGTSGQVYPTGFN